MNQCFRGRRADTGEWISGRSVLSMSCDGEPQMFMPVPDTMISANIGANGMITRIDNCSIARVEPDTVTRATGLSDSQGAPIFEGDIIAGGEGRYAIRWNENAVAFVAEPLDGGAPTHTLNRGAAQYYTVAGTTFDSAVSEVPNEAAP